MEEGSLASERDRGDQTGQKPSGVLIVAFRVEIGWEESDLVATLWRGLGGR